ncbi:hypothetical protein [Dickeya lacustris]|uniref:hypothetical protein n=1 Tax=Dickeya lacustris TaxID=2259638 RepID=UPI0022BA1635|nr:hypothetical protein [Dickeya lacustris]
MAALAPSDRLRALLPRVVSGVDPGEVEWQPLGGLSHQSVSIHSPTGRWLARGETTHGRQMGIARQREFRVLRHLTGFAPHALCWRDGWLLVEWLSGTVPEPAQFAALLHSGELARLLAELHHRPRYGYPLRLAYLLEQHWQNMAPARRTPKLRRAIGASAREGCQRPVIWLRCIWMFMPVIWWRRPAVIA